MVLQELVQIHSQHARVGTGFGQTTIAFFIAVPFVCKVIIDEALYNTILVSIDQLNYFPNVATQPVGMAHFDDDGRCSGFVVVENEIGNGRSVATACLTVVKHGFG